MRVVLNGNKTSKARHKKKRNVPIIGILLIVAGLACLSFPFVADGISRWKQSTSISTAESTITHISAEEHDKQLDQANRYNKMLAGTDTNDSSIKPYEEQLEYNADSTMGWLDIPSLGLNINIYRGTSDDALISGLGHMDTSSLPVGGGGTHCVLAGHSGMPNFRCLDDADKLQEGDLLYLHVLGDTLAYRVTDSELVNPDETSSLRIVDGKDLLTLVTCRPIGVNTQRLLVHAERCDIPADATSGITRYLDWRDEVVIAIAIVIAIVILFILIRIEIRLFMTDDFARRHEKALTVLGMLPRAKDKPKRKQRSHQPRT